MRIGIIGAGEIGGTLTRRLTGKVLRCPPKPKHRAGAP